MNNKNITLSRRNFLKLAGLSAGGVALAGTGAIALMDEQPAIFEPNNGFWALAQPPANPPLAQNIQVDVAVIGGGYTGLSAACHLMKTNPRLNVAVLEARQVGHGASGRNGGMVLSQTVQEDMTIAKDEQTHLRTYNLTVNSMREMEKVVASTGVDAELKLDGYLYAILDEKDAADEAEYVADANALGMPLEFWDAKETRDALGTEMYHGAIFDPNGGSVHAMKLAHALKVAAEKAGARIYENSAVTQIQEGRQIALKANGYAVTANAIVLATNAYTSKLGYFKHQVMPVHAQCAVTPRLSEKQLQEMGWHSRLPFFDSRNFVYHLILTADNRVVIGGGSADYFFRNDLQYRGDLKAAGKIMLDELVKMYPSLRGIQFESVWDGLLGMSFDEIETVGVTGANKNIYYGLAYNGHGVNNSFLFGDVIASLYHGVRHDWQDTAYANYQLTHIPPEPFKWIGVQGIMKYYQMQDQA